MSGYITSWPFLALSAVAAGVLLRGGMSAVRALRERSAEPPPCGTTIRSPSGSVDARRIAMLALGAPLSAHWHVYADSLETGRDVDVLAGILRDSWGVEDGASFREIIAPLAGEGGHRRRFELACRIYHATPRAAWEQAIAASGGDPKTLRAQLARIDDLMPRLKEASLGGHDDVGRGVSAWDFSRLVSLTRAAFDCGYIPREEAWSLIEQAYRAALAHNRSWREVAASYLIGRVIWGGGDDDVDHFIEVSARMLADPKSPWRTTILA